MGEGESLIAQQGIGTNSVSSMLYAFCCASSTLGYRSYWNIVGGSYGAV